MPNRGIREEPVFWKEENTVLAIRIVDYERLATTIMA